MEPEFMNIFSPHIQFSDLADLAEERSTTSAEARGHLASCSECSAQLHSIKQTLGLMRSDATEDAPAASVAYAKNIFRNRAGTRQPSILTRLMAALTFDSLTMAPAFGLRSHTTAGRQLIYSTETADIDVRVSHENELWLIAGQVLGAECGTGDVDLEGDNFSTSAKLSELCEFSFGSVPAGAYKISVRLPEVLIETPPLELGP
jgi:hypothetical protein